MSYLTSAPWAAGRWWCRGWLWASRRGNEGFLYKANPRARRETACWIQIEKPGGGWASGGIVEVSSWLWVQRTGEIISTASACGKSFPALLATKQRFQPTRPGIIRQIYQNIAMYSNFLLYSHIFHYIPLYFTIFGYILPCLPPFWSHLWENIAKYSTI